MLVELCDSKGIGVVVVVVYFSSTPNDVKLQSITVFGNQILKTGTKQGCLSRVSKRKHWVNFDHSGPQTRSSWL